ncbi:ribonuclease H-like domain-containing protein [Tanacetum coccineum]
MMVVKEIENKLLEEVEKLEWWFEQDIDDEGEKDEEDRGGDEACQLIHFRFPPIKFLRACPIDLNPSRNVDAHQIRFGGNDESKRCRSTSGAVLKDSLYPTQTGIQKAMRDSKSLSQYRDSWRRGMDSLSFDDLYNNLRVFENDVKGSTASSSNLQNVAFKFKLRSGLLMLPIIEEYESDVMMIQTRTGNNPVNTVKASGTNYVSTARQNINKQTVLTSTALKVNTVKPSVNDVRPQNAFNKTHSLPSRPLKGTTVLRTKLTNQKIYIAKDNPHRTLKNKGIIDSGCSRHMTGNKAYLADYQDINGGPVAFGGSRGYITGKGKIQTGKLDFEDVSFVKELQHFNLFSVSQMCDKKNKVLFTDSECLVLSSEFKLPDENQGHRQEEGIDYDEVFAPVASIEAIRIFLAFALA